MKTEGIPAKLVAVVMATRNADMEQAAIDRLDPAPHHRVLEIGFGPGVGIEILAARLTAGRVADWTGTAKSGGTVSFSSVKP